jgi:hypothetical protein
MPDRNYAHILVILDRSGSMEHLAEDTIGGLNRLIADQAAQEGRCTLSLVQFDHEYQRPISFMPIGSVPPRDRSNYVPRGQTALWDAVGRAITEEGEYLARMPEESRPGLVTVVILTDGKENHSREWRKARVSALIEQQTRDYAWVVQFLGASLEVAAQGTAVGVRSAHVADYRSTEDALLAVSHSTTRGRSATVRGAGGDAVAAEMAYTSDERAKMRGEVPELHQGGPVDPAASAVVQPPRRTRGS